MEGSVARLSACSQSLRLQGPSPVSTPAVTCTELPERLECTSSDRGHVRFQGQPDVKSSKDTTLLFEEKKNRKPDQRGGFEVSTDPTARGQLAFPIPPQCQFQASSSSSVESRNEAPGPSLPLTNLRSRASQLCLLWLSFPSCTTSEWQLCLAMLGQVWH